jgi:hypothetical protein
MITGKYTGPLAEGVREGQGVLEWSNGDKYEGLFKGGLRHGHVSDTTYSSASKEHLIPMLLHNI